MNNRRGMRRRYGRKPIKEEQWLSPEAVERDWEAR